MPMMHPEDEANTDAPLVPMIQTPNRPPTRTETDQRDAASIRRELEELRSRIDDLESNLQERSEY